MAGGSRRAILAAFFANLGIAIAKFAGFAITRSSSMLAEGVHSVADTSNQALLLLGGRRAARPATPEHPFGYGRERYFWAFVVAVVLFTLGSAFALYEGIEKLLHPEPIESPQVAIGILLVVIVLEGASLRTAVVEANRARGRSSWTAYIRRSKEPELPVVLLEDLGAMIGLVVALAAVCLSVVTDDPRWDGWGSIVIGLLLGVIALVLASEMKSLLIGESAEPHRRREIVEAIESTTGVQELIHLRTQHLGPEELLVAAKVAFEPGLELRDLAQAVDDLEARVRARVPEARPIYIEPDVLRS